MNFSKKVLFQAIFVFIPVQNFISHIQAKPLGLGLKALIMWILRIIAIGLHNRSEKFKVERLLFGFQ